MSVMDARDFAKVLERVRVPYAILPCGVRVTLGALTAALLVRIETRELSERIEMENITFMGEGIEYELDVMYYKALEEVAIACQRALDNIDDILFGWREDLF